LDGQQRPFHSSPDDDNDDNDDNEGEDEGEDGDTRSDDHDDTAPAAAPQKYTCECERKTCHNTDLTTGDYGYLRGRMRMMH
jgi:hypothetical protein